MLDPVQTNLLKESADALILYMTAVVSSLAVLYLSK